MCEDIPYEPDGPDDEAAEAELLRRHLENVSDSTPFSIEMETLGGQFVSTYPTNRGQFISRLEEATLLLSTGKTRSVVIRRGILRPNDLSDWIRVIRITKRGVATYNLPPEGWDMLAPPYEKPQEPPKNP